MHLVCRQCSTRLTTDLELLPFAVRNEEVEQDFVERGGLMQVEPCFYFDNNIGSFVANIADTEHVVLTTDITRLYGCCGVGDCGKPNLQCEGCATYVATKSEQCCTPHYIVFDPTTTEAV